VSKEVSIEVDGKGVKVQDGITNMKRPWIAMIGPLKVLKNTPRYSERVFPGCRVKGAGSFIKL